MFRVFKIGVTLTWCERPLDTNAKQGAHNETNIRTSSPTRRQDGGVDCSDNYGHFMLLDIHNRIVGGEASRRFSMSAESVYLWCWEWADTGKEPPPPIPSVIWLPSH
jgi:hypothetical protein